MPTVVYSDLRQEESLLQIFSALETLENVANAVFTKITARVRAARMRIHPALRVNSSMCVGGASVVVCGRGLCALGQMTHFILFFVFLKKNQFINFLQCTIIFTSCDSTTTLTCMRRWLRTGTS